VIINIDFYLALHYGKAAPMLSHFTFFFISF